MLATWFDKWTATVAQSHWNKVSLLDTEMNLLKTKVENQRERIKYLEGATNHASGTPLSKALEENEKLKEQADKKGMKGLIYLACPYSGTPEEMEERTRKVTRETAALMLYGYKIFSPITHSHYVAKYLPEKYWQDHDFWLEQDMAVLKHCGALFVYCLPGWQKSYGVNMEIKRANELGIPIRYI